MTNAWDERAELYRTVLGAPDLERRRAVHEPSLRVLVLDDGDAGGELGDSGDTADALESEGVDNAVEASLDERLAAVERAEERLAAGTFGLHVGSGLCALGVQFLAHPRALGQARFPPRRPTRARIICKSTATCCSS